MNNASGSTRMVDCNTLQRREWGRWIARFTCGTLLLCSLLSCSREEQTHQQIIQRDLQAILKEMGAECPAIDKYEYSQRHQYLVTCTNDKRYRISVDAEGRIQLISLD